MGCGAAVQGAQPETTEPGELTAADQEFLDFYRGTGKDSHGRTLAEMWGWDDHAMEKQHNYIQVMFPTDQKSQFNANAPDFGPLLQEAFRNDHEVMANIAKSFDVFCTFLGLHYDEVHEACERTEKFSLKARNWLTYTNLGPNHNWLRCTRVLHCLRLLGEWDRRDAFYEALEKIYVDGMIPSRFQDTIKFWQQAGGIEGRPIPQQQLHPSACEKSTSSAMFIGASPRKRRGFNRAVTSDSLHTSHTQASKTSRATHH